MKNSKKITLAVLMFGLGWLEVYLDIVNSMPIAWIIGFLGFIAYLIFDYLDAYKQAYKAHPELFVRRQVEEEMSPVEKALDDMSIHHMHDPSKLSYYIHNDFDDDYKSIFTEDDNYIPNFTGIIDYSSSSSSISGSTDIDDYGSNASITDDNMNMH